MRSDADMPPKEYASLVSALATASRTRCETTSGFTNEKQVLAAMRCAAIGIDIEQVHNVIVDRL
jgi:hypothetical protein